MMFADKRHSVKASLLKGYGEKESGSRRVKNDARAMDANAPNLDRNTLEIDVIQSAEYPQSLMGCHAA
jgi:hypothetical protein